MQYFLKCLLTICIFLNATVSLAQDVTIGDGSSHNLRNLVEATSKSKGLHYTFPASPGVAFVRSDNGNGDDEVWNTGQEHLPTLQTICKIMGYKTYVRSTCYDLERSGRYPYGKCNYHSVSDDNLVRFNTATNNFTVEGASPKYNKTWIATITCRDLITQCNDGIDNDNDGVTDSGDPGCSNNQDNDESDKTTQCQDGIDNDQDGAVDFPNDFSCSSKTDNDETNPKAQCQDGIDNDGDGVVDLNDPGCSSRQDNNEGDKTTQCQDGIDNDQDGAVDFPNDFSCSSRTDNDETNPKSQCQDGIDNDNDGLADLNDPGCSNNQDNNEGDKTTQCQDGIDNDGDGAIDFPNDYSCTSKTDNDETNPKSQCQDGLDNDNDGVADSADPGCSTNQDNDESDKTTQCQDGIDNDGDGAIDYPNDFSCTSKTDNDESNPKSQCQDGLDNDNDGLTDLIDPGCSNNQDNNEGDKTTQCQDGSDNDSDGKTDFPNDPGCQSKTDNDESNLDSNEATPCQDGIDNDQDGLIDLNDPGCSSPADTDESDEYKQLTAILECVEQTSASAYRAYFGYNNSNSKTIALPVGPLNTFSPVASNQGQPAAFLSGARKNAFSVVFDGRQIDWKLGNSTVSASSLSPRCEAASCNESDITATLILLDSGANRQLTLIKKALKQLKRQTSLTKPGELLKTNTYSNKALQQATLLYKEAWSTTWTIPKKILDCNSAAQCVSVDNQPTINHYRELISELKDITLQVSKKLAKLKSEKAVSGAKKINADAAKLYDDNIGHSNTVPVSNDQCA